MDSSRWFTLIILFIIVLGFSVYPIYRAYEIKKALLGSWQAEFVVDPNLKNTKQVTAVQLDLNDNGTMTFARETFEDQIELGKDRNGFDTLASHGTSKMKTTLTGTYKVEKNVLRLHLETTADRIRTSFPFRTDKSGEDPNSGKPFIDLSADFDLKRANLVLVLSSSKEFPDVTLVKSVASYKNDYILKAQDAPSGSPDSADMAVHTKTISYDRPLERRDRVLRARELAAEDTAPASAPTYQPIQEPAEKIQIDFEQCSYLPPYDRLSMNDGKGIRVLDFEFLDDLCHFRIYWSPAEGIGTLKDCRFPKTNTIGKIYKVAMTDSYNNPTETWQYQLDLGRCSDVPVGSSQTLVSELNLTRPSPEEEQNSSGIQNQGDTPPQPQEDIRNLSVQERLRRARMQEELGK